ncbi:MAG: hypothetical protein ABI337_03025 [Nitrososphaera sp.]
MGVFQINKNSLKINKNNHKADSNLGKFGVRALGKPIPLGPELQQNKEIAQWREQNKEKIAKLIDTVNKNYDGIIIPEVSYTEGTFQYAALKEIEESSTNYEFLEKLTQSSNLERFVFNKFLVCSEHQNSFLVNVRLYCPKCNSIEIERLHLLEHKSCGYLGEKKTFTDEDEKLKCPSCNKLVKNPAKEIRVPATWYYCINCKEKFDDAAIRLHCKEFEHDFDVNETKTVTIYGYKVVSSTKPEFDHVKLKTELSQIATKLGFSIDEDHIIKGRSGHDHRIDIYGTDKKNQTLFIMLNNLHDNELDSKIIQILDTAPKIAILVGHSSISEKTKSIAAKYNVSIISSQNTAEILSEVEKIIAYRLKKLEGASDK